MSGKYASIDVGTYVSTSKMQNLDELIDQVNIEDKATGFGQPEAKYFGIEEAQSLSKEPVIEQTKKNNATLKKTIEPYAPGGYKLLPAFNPRKKSIKKSSLSNERASADPDPINESETPMTLLPTLYRKTATKMDGKTSTKMKMSGNNSSQLSNFNLNSFHDSQHRFSLESTMKSPSEKERNEKVKQ